MECIVIPDTCYSYTTHYSVKRATCCKCKNYKEFVVKVDIYNGPNKTKKQVRVYEKDGSKAY